MIDKATERWQNLRKQWRRNNYKGVANTRGKIWVTNGVTNKLINPNELENYKKMAFIEVEKYEKDK